MKKELTIDDIRARPPPKRGTSRWEIIHQDEDGQLKNYRCTELLGGFPAIILNAVPEDNRPVEVSPFGTMKIPGGKQFVPPMPPIGPVGGALIIIPTVGHTKVATDLLALSGWQMAIGIGTTAEASTDTALASEITTYGGARATVTPTRSTNVLTFSNKFTFTTGASFACSEAGLFKDTVLVARNVYSAIKNVIAGDSLTVPLTCTT